MPDVKAFIKDDITPDHNFHKPVCRVTAMQLTCKECKVEPEQVDVMIFPIVDGEQYPMDVPRLYSNADVILEVSGYAYTTRMANIDERIAAIAATVKRALGLGPDRRVCITYFVVQDKCWAAV